MKYILTKNTKKIDDIILHQIRAIRSFGNVQKGDLGGYVETDANLTHYGNAWVKDNAIASGNALVCDDALVSGNSWVSGNVLVDENAIVSGNVLACENARISGNVILNGSVQVYGYASISDNVLAYDNAVICGNTIVNGNAIISGKTYVSGDTWIGGNALIKKPRHVIWLCPVGPENSTLTAYMTKEGKIEVTYTHFRGFLEEFEAKIKNHGNTKYEQEYLSLIPIIRRRFEEEGV